MKRKAFSNGRVAPFSLRAEINKQLDTDPLGAVGVEQRENTVRGHLNFVYETLLVNPLMDIRRYRIATDALRPINPNNPSTTLMG